MKFYTTQQVAELMQLHLDTVRRYIREGRIETYKFGKAYKISEEQLKKFIETGK